MFFSMFLMSFHAFLVFLFVPLFVLFVVCSSPLLFVCFPFVSVVVSFSRCASSCCSFYLYVVRFSLFVCLLFLYFSMCVLLFIVFKLLYVLLFIVFMIIKTIKT